MRIPVRARARFRSILAVPLVGAGLLAAFLSCGGDDDEDSGGNLDVTIQHQSQFGRRVDLYVTVKEAGKTDNIGTLTEDNFSTLEDGKDLGSEVVARVVRDNLLDVALVLDLSSSMQEAAAVDSLIVAATRFIDDLPDGTNVGIYQFAELYSRAADVTSDKDVLKDTLYSLEALPADEGGRFTNLYGATLFAAIELLTGVYGEGNSRAPCVVVFTDGHDNVEETTRDKLTTMLKENGVSLYTVALGAELQELDLRVLATTGSYVRAAGKNDLDGAFDKVAEYLRSIYLLEYHTPKKAGDHTLDLNVTIGAKTGSAHTTFSLADYDPVCEFRQCSFDGKCGVCAGGDMCDEDFRCSRVEGSIELKPGVLARGNIAQGGEEAVYWFTAEAGRRYSLELGGDLAGRYELYGADDKTRVRKGDAGKIVEWIADNSTPYFLHVMGADETATGEFTLALGEPE